MSMRSFINLVESAQATSVLTEAAIPLISPQEARDRKMFGPVYHGTRNIEAIMSAGFSLDHAENERSNGYPFQAYSRGGALPAPVHHLGFGIYFTTEKATAKRFNGDTVRGLKEFWLDIPNYEEINFGSPNTMMKWWFANGYRPSTDILARGDRREWVEQTRALTDKLSGEFDAVWFKGKGIHRLLDGDQVCVYDPSRIYAIDAALATGLEVGAKVVHTQAVVKYRARNDVYIDPVEGDTRFVGWQGYYRAIDHDGNEMPKDRQHPIHLIPPPGMIGTIMSKQDVKPEFAHAHQGAKAMYAVKWAKGGVQYNYYDSELAPAASKSKKK